MKKLSKILTTISMTLLLCLCLCFVSSAADVGRVTGLKASDVTNNTVTISWNRISAADGYRVQYRIDDGAWSDASDSVKSTSYIFKNLKIGSSYSFRVTAYKEKSTLFGGITKDYGTPSTVVSVSNSLAKVTGLKVVKTTPTKVKLTWNSVTGADGYLIQKNVNGSGWKSAKSTTSTTYTVTGFSMGQTISFRVKAYVKSGDKKIYGSVSSTVKGKTQVPDVTNFKIASSDSDSVKLKWTKEASVTGYQIYKKTASGSWKKYKNIYDNKTVTFTDSKISVGTKYYYKVRAFYKTKSKTYYGDFTSAKSVTPKLDAVIGIELTSLTTTKAILTWDKVEGAQGYQVYDYSSGKAKKLPTVKTNKTSISITDGNIYKIKIRAYTKDTADGSTSKGTFSEVFDIYSKPDRVEGLLSEVLADGSLKLTWNAVDHAWGYSLYVLNNEEKEYQKIKETDTNYIILEDISGLPGANFRVAAYVKNDGAYLYGEVSDTILGRVIMAPELSLGYCSEDSITLTWNAIAEADVYVLERYDFDSDSWVLLKETADTQFIDKTDYAKGCLYRVYAKKTGTRGAASNEVFGCTKGLTLTQDGAAQTLTWPAIEGAARYRVLVKHTEPGSRDTYQNKIYANVTGTSAVLSLTPGTTQSVAVYAYTESGDWFGMVVDELVIKVDDFKKLPSIHEHYDHSINSQLLYLVEAINKTKHETATVTVTAESDVTYTTEKFYINNTAIDGDDIEGLLKLVNKLSGENKDASELDSTTLSGTETSDETLTFNGGIAKNTLGKSVNLARYIDPSDEEYAYLYGSENPSAWRDGVKSVTVSETKDGGYKFVIVLYEETFGTETNVSDAFYHPGFVTTIASLGFFNQKDLENELTTVGDTTITAVINADGTLESYKSTSPYSMKMVTPVEGVIGIKSFGMQMKGSIVSTYEFKR